MTEQVSRRAVLQGGAAAGLSLGVLAYGASAAAAQPLASAAGTPVIGTTPYKAAVVTAPSVEFDLAASVDKAVSLIREAARNGARLVAFGELWLPGYPEQLNFQADWLTAVLPTYAKQALVVGGRGWEQVRRAASDNKITVAIGYSERGGKYLYMGQSVFGPDGTPLIVRRKIRPSGGERNIFSDSPLGENIKVVDTELGRLGALSCWEHLHPEMTYNMLAQLESVHVAAWPYNSLPGASVQWWEDVEVALSATRMHAINGGSYVLLPGKGFGAILSPKGQLIVQSATGKEDLLYGTIDPSQFTTTSANPEGENSWGVLRLLASTYPGPRVPDPEHGTLNLVPVPA